MSYILPSGAKPQVHRSRGSRQPGSALPPTHPPPAWWVRWEARKSGSSKRSTNSGARLYEFKSHLVTH